MCVPVVLNVTVHVIRRLSLFSGTEAKRNLVTSAPQDFLFVIVINLDSHQQLNTHCLRETVCNWIRFVYVNMVHVTSEGNRFIL